MVWLKNKKTSYSIFLKTHFLSQYDMPTVVLEVTNAHMRNILVFPSHMCKKQVDLLIARSGKTNTVRP